jgi:Ca-activated chloride channel homolog
MRTTIRLATASLMALLLTGIAHAAAAPPETTAGALEARGPKGAVLGTCPLKHTDVAAEISGFVARVTVTQVFENPFGEPVEAVYTFPLSERAAVDDMSMRTGDRVVRGEIKRREDARRIYEAARNAGQVAALLDQERPNIFTQTLANLLPGASVEVKIEYVEPLVFHDGTFEFSFPTVVGPRFVPGQLTGRTGTGWASDTTRVPDASCITPPVTPKGTRAGHDVAIAVDIDAGVPILDVASALHEVDVERPDATHARVHLRDRAEIPNRDFVLRYAVADDEVRSGYLVHRDGGADGYVTFVLLPPKRVTAETAAPKEMIFVIDRSGSQAGAPLEKAKETMHWILDHMNPNDTFQVVDFGNTANLVFARPEPASPEMRARARAHIDALEANGGTMMAEAVRAVCAEPADANRLRVVTFMTDGYIGNDFEVIDLVRSLRGTSRWFSFGAGNGVNRFLLEGIARAGGGEVDYILLNDSGEAVARRFYDRIASPALTDVRLEFRGLDVVDVFPTQPSDVWDRRPLIVHARYRRAGRGQVILSGFRQGRPYRQALDVTLPDRAESNAAIASMWAHAKVEDLMWQDLPGLQSRKVPTTLREDIVSIALAHRLVTQFTSFVAVEDGVVNQGGSGRTVAVPVEMPDGVSYEGVFGTAGSDEERAVGGRLFARSPAAAVRSLAAMSDRFETTAEKRDIDEAPAPSRLAPELQALVDGVPPGGRPVRVDAGRVTVKVVVRNTRAATLRRLEAAGLRVRQVARRWVLGSVPVEKLAALAALAEVESIVLP